MDVHTVTPVAIAAAAHYYEINIRVLKYGFEPVFEWDSRGKY